MIDYEINGRTISIPLSWYELTTGQFIQIIESERLNKGDAIELISILTGMDYDFLFMLKMRQYDFDTIVELIAWFNEEMPALDRLPMRNALSLDGTFHEIPRDLTAKSWGQKITLEQKVFECVEATENMSSMIDVAVAIYIQESYTGKPFDPDALQSTIDAVRKTKLVDCYPIAAFFLNNCLQSLRSKKLLSSQNSNRKNSKQTFNNLIPLA